jgi:hypothetical protein
MPGGARFPAVPVLHADHRRDGPGLVELSHGDAGDAELPDQPGVAQVGQGGEPLGQRILALHPQVDHVEMVAAELAQVLLDLAAQLVRPDGSRPGPTLVTMTSPSG